MITCCNLISGCIATYFAFQGNFPAAMVSIIAGAVFDFFDGMTARLLHVSSPIGKELDSLADVVTFGVAPSAIVFSFLGQSPMDNVQWIAFLMAAFSALRLAKFNLDERQAMGFIGLPTPANALFWASLINWLDLQLLLESYTLPTYIYYGVVVLVFVSCYLLIAEIPMFALKFKTWGWHDNEVKYVFLTVSLAIIVSFHSIISIAVVIAWYVLLSLITNRKKC